MTKRHAEQGVYHDAPFKKPCCRPLYKIDTQLQSTDPGGCVNPPSLLALLGRRCKKRPHYFDEQEEPHNILSASCDHHRVSVIENVLVKKCGSFRESSPPAKSASLTSKKRVREDTAASTCDATKREISKDDDADDSDLCTFNSFQFWRVPLPEIDLSIVQINYSSGPIEGPTVKDLSSDAMES
ncbi:hypothetical protein DPEC_G00123970 [Dallia pectoralis]|uniref:Uncharacterized protein n=1 Tax=Dallia pectoralis TaxID=75939 RepID=A0ACC2GRG2_DALPE|nr:hypothetical protein DPEC_G00123970 [Dallia pectoralis]